MTPESFAVLAKVPWWRMHPGRDIDILFCPTIQPPAYAGDDRIGKAVQGLLDATRQEIFVTMARGPA